MFVIVTSALAVTSSGLRLAGLSDRKGAIAPGRDADLVLWDPDADITVDPSALEHRHPVTPYAGVRLKGQVRRTLLRGEVIFDNGEFNWPPRGQFLLTGACSC